MSVVRDAAIAASIGVRGKGVTSMHDATERGLFGGLHEIAEASGVGMAIEANSIDMAPEVRAICGLFGIDPFTTSSEGTLILTCVAPMARVLVERLGEHGIPAHHIGEVLPPEGGVQLLRDGRSEPLPRPTDDPFWPAFTRARDGSGS
jgi:hydrogenase maturation factor